MKVYKGHILTVDKDDTVARYLVEDRGIIAYTGDDLPEEYYLLPSSQHEVIIVPAFEGMDASLFIDMVRYVNATEVDPADVLSDNAYHCVNGVFSIVGDEKIEVSL